MNATQFLDSIWLLLDRSLYGEARQLFKRVKMETPGMLTQQAWDSVQELIPAGSPSAQKGYRYARYRCPHCGKEVACNWRTRHEKSNCELPRS